MYQWSSLNMAISGHHTCQNFIRLGYNHNYGRAFELVCWLKTGNNDDQLASIDPPYLSLLYTFEVGTCQTTRDMTLKHIVPQLREAIIKFAEVDKYPMHKTYMLLGAQRCLDDLLQSYAMYECRRRNVLKIQRWWRSDIYHNPYKKRCADRLLNEFNVLQAELFIHLDATQDCV